MVTLSKINWIRDAERAHSSCTLAKDPDRGWQTHMIDSFCCWGTHKKRKSRERESDPSQTNSRSRQFNFRKIAATKIDQGMKGRQACWR